MNSMTLALAAAGVYLLTRPTTGNGTAGNGTETGNAGNGTDHPAGTITTAQAKAWGKGAVFTVEINGHRYKHAAADPAVAVVALNAQEATSVLAALTAFGVRKPEMDLSLERPHGVVGADYQLRLFVRDAAVPTGWVHTILRNVGPINRVEIRRAPVVSTAIDAAVNGAGGAIKDYLSGK